MKKTQYQKIKRFVFTLIRSFGMSKKSTAMIQDLSVLIGSGTTVSEALYAILEETDSWRLRSALNEVVEDINEGMSLSKSFERAKIVSSYTLALITFGERSGKLKENLKIAARHEEKDAIFRSRVRGAISYGSFVVTISIVVGIGISWSILPQISTFFDELDAPLPYITIVIIAIGKFIGEYGFIFVPLFIVFIIMLVYFLFSFPKTKFIGHTILFHLPAIGKLIKETEVSRLGLVVGSMTSAGIPLRSIFSLLPETTTFNNYRKLYRHIGDRIIEGKTFKESFRSYKGINKLIPVSARKMIATSEKSGTLSDTFNKVGEIYETKVDLTSRSIPLFLEPLLLIIVGCIVLVLALGVLLPIYNLGLYV